MSKTMSTTPTKPDSVTTTVATALEPAHVTEFFSVTESKWQSLIANTGGPPEEQSRANQAKQKLHNQLLASLQMQHVMVLAGSGTSLGTSIGGPSMWTLWDHCVNSNPDTGSDARTEKPDATKIINDVGYDKLSNKENIEALLSQCDAFLQYKPTESHVLDFVNTSKAIILKKCSEFIDPSKPDQLSSHTTFLHKLSRRRARDSRLKLFTTNYDLCFEAAAGKQGIVAIDGFSFSQPRYFDPRFFQYDIIKRTPVTGDLLTPLEGVFQLLKLHGSVNWERQSDAVAINPQPNPNNACLIYPAKGKYQQSYIQPHLELVSQYFSSLREPNTCVLTIGFGFNDDHLSEPLLAAIKSNPHIRLIVVSLFAKGCSEGTDTNRTNRYWKAWYQLAQDGADILIIDATFDDFAKLIPDLTSLTPAEKLARSVAALAGEH
jgi:SIR2-like domain